MQYSLLAEENWIRWQHNLHKLFHGKQIYMVTNKSLKLLHSPEKKWHNNLHNPVQHINIVDYGKTSSEGISNFLLFKINVQMRVIFIKNEFKNNWNII